MSTPLWRQTLAPFEGDEHAEPRGYLRAALLKLRKSMAVLLGELGPSMPAYTVHDVTHADALWETASLVTGPDVDINPAEGFVLGAAFLFHDAAMGLAAYPDGPAVRLGPDRWRDLLCATFRTLVGRWPMECEVDDPLEDVVAVATQTAVRESHANRRSAPSGNDRQRMAENDRVIALEQVRR